MLKKYHLFIVILILSSLLISCSEDESSYQSHLVVKVSTEEAETVIEDSKLFYNDKTDNDNSKQHESKIDLRNPAVDDMDGLFKHSPTYEHLVMLNFDTVSYDNEGNAFIEAVFFKNFVYEDKFVRNLEIGSEIETSEKYMIIIEDIKWYESSDEVSAIINNHYQLILLPEGWVLFGPSDVPYTHAVDSMEIVIPNNIEIFDEWNWHHDENMSVDSLSELINIYSWTNELEVYIYIYEENIVSYIIVFYRPG